MEPMVRLSYFWSSVKIAVTEFLFPTVLSWDGDVSAISQDAIEDVHQAKFDTVIDEWDEDFDRGKVRKTLILP